MSRCNKHIGDNDATNPQLTCIRGTGHPGLCDNERGDFQVFAVHSGQTHPFPISFAYEYEIDANRVAARARATFPAWIVEVAFSEKDTNEIHYGNAELHTVSHPDAIELFKRLGW